MPAIDIDDNDTDIETDPDAPQETARDLRRAAKDGKAARSEATALARELVMLKAGIDTDMPLGKLFSDGYSGELTKEAAKAAFAALGTVTPTADEAPLNPDTPLADGEDRSTAERQALALGAPADTPVSPEPVAAAKQAAESVVAKGGTTADALAAMFGQLVNAAASGDKRVIIGAQD